MYSINNINIGIINRNRDFDGGRGTINNPYRIVKIRHFNNVRKYSNAYYRLENDIIFTDEFEVDGEYYNDGLLWRPASSFDNGGLDGQGYKVENLKTVSNGNNQSAIVNSLGSNSYIKNIYFKNLDFDGGSNDFVGGISEILNSNSFIEGCFIDGTISGSVNVSPFAQRSTNSNVRIKRCGSNVTINASNIIGGIFSGRNSIITIEDCYSRGLINGGLHRAGITGSRFGMNVIRCYSAIVIDGSSTLKRGLISERDSSGGSAIESFWDIETTTAQSSADGGIGLTSEQSKFPYPEYAEGVSAYSTWDFDTIWNDDTTGINGGYPYLRNITPGGELEDYTYLIDTFEDDNLLTNFDDGENENLLII